MACRSWDVGGDAAQYLNLYNLSSLYGVEQAFDHFVQYYLGTYGGLDPGFDLLVYKPAQELGLGYQFALATEAACITMPFGRFVYRYSKDCFQSFLVFGTVFLAVIGLAGMRQSIAMAFAVFIGYDFVISRKFVLFAILITLCYSIHASAILFFPFYFISGIRLSSMKTAIFLVIIAAIFPLAGSFAPQLYAAVGYDDYSYSYVGVNVYIYAAMFVAMALVVIVKLQAILAANQEAGRSVVALLVVVAVIPFAFFNSNAMRAAWYYMLFLTLLIPYLVEASNVRMRPFINFGIIVACVFALLFTGPLVLPANGYSFFWMQ